MTDGVSSPDRAPLAASPAAGTDAASTDDATEPRRFWARLEQPFALGFAITLGGLVAVLLALTIGNLSTILIYIVFALFAALGIDPIVRWLESHNIPRTWSIVIVFFALAILGIGVILLILPTVIDQIVSFATDIPSLVRGFEQSDFFHWLETIFGAGLSDLLADAQKFLTDPGNIAAIGGGALQVGADIASGISGIVIVIVLTLYFIATLDAMKSAFYRLMPARNRPRIADLTEKITSSVGSYLMGMVILAFINAIVVLILYISMGLPFPALIAMTAFFITLIPLVGSVLVWGIGSVFALFTSPVLALIFAVAYLVYMQLEAYVLTPRVMNRAIAIPGSLVVIGALVGGTLLGLLGALVAIPVTASILLIIKQVAIPRQDAKV